MPPSQRPEEPPENGNSINGNAPAAQPGRELLRSLEALRDSLAIRVNQLATAVERLRRQAEQLESSIGGEAGVSGPSGSVHQVLDPRAIRNPDPLSDMPTHSPPSPEAHVTTSAIASEVNQLERPITSAEIFRLLERASVTLADTPNHFTPDMEHTLGGLREVQNSLQGNVREMAEIGETQTRLRQSIRTRWERVTQQASESEQRGNSRRAESPQQESVRRLAEIAREGEIRRAERKACRAQTTSPKRRGLPPTNKPTTTPIIVQSSTVPLRPASRPIKRRTPTPLSPSNPADPTLSANTRNSLSHLDAPSLDALHTQIAELDLNLEPAEYMSGLSTIIRQAIVPRSDSISGDGNANELRAAQSPVESLVLRASSPTLSVLSDSSLDTVAATVNDNIRDAGLTYRGRDVQDRIRSAAMPLDLESEEGDAPVAQTIHERVAAMLEVERTLEPRGEIDTRNQEALQASTLSSHRDRLERLRQHQLQSAREVARDPMRSVHNAAQSARELVNAATVITENLASQRAREERDIAYESSVQAELRIAQAARDRAYNLYQRVVSARARHHSLPSPPGGTASMARSVSGQGRPEGTVVTVVPVIDADTVQRDALAEDASRRMFQAAQMREAAIQQRLNWARSRLRRDTNRPDGLADGGSEREGMQVLGSRAHVAGESASRRVMPHDQDFGRAGPFSPRTYRQAIGQASIALVDRRNMQNPIPSLEEAVDHVTSSQPRLYRESFGSVRRTAGPRDERTEEVDTMVRIRQLQDQTLSTRPTTLSARASRRRQIRQLRLEVEADVGGGDEQQAEREEGLQRLARNADQVTQARRELYAALDDTNWGVTPSSPITARGNGNFSHIQISVGSASTPTEQEMRDWMGDGDEAVRRMVQNVLENRLEGGESSGASSTSGVIPVERLEEAAHASSGEDPSKKRESINPLLPTDESKPSAHVWPSGRAKRRERVYISLLDL